MALLIRKILLGVLALVAGALAAQAQAPPLEYQVKASYLYNFVRFITWPEDVFARDNHFNLCVVGAERFGGALDAIPGERVEGREIAIRRIKDVTQARSARCHLLFIAADGQGMRPDTAGARGMLTVGETPGFLEQGGVINLIDAHGRIRFEINQQAARDAGLTISSRLLSLAQKR